MSPGRPDDPSAPGRAPRRHARLRCVLKVEGGEVMGFTYNISTTGLYVRVAEEDVAVLAPRLGRVYRLDLHLVGPLLTLATEAKLVWVNRLDRDASGRSVVGFGMKLVDPAQEDTRRLETFVHEFRYPVMVVDDERANLELLRRTLRKEYRIFECSSAEEALAILKQEEVAALLTDQRMPGMSGLDLLRRIGQDLPHAHTRKIVLSAYPETQEIQDFINEGRIAHYLTKPFETQMLLQIVRQAVDAYAMAVENERLQGELQRANRSLHQENVELRRRAGGLQLAEPIIGESALMRQLMETIKQVAPTDVTVLIRGETGTGKELVARALHSLSPRHQKAFIAINCAALPESLVESELFGHERGAFTGATSRRLGRFERAHGGTLLIDEVGDMPLAVQAKLLRVLQTGTFERLGSNEGLAADVRLVAATHRDLEQMIDEGKFREDLFYRLNVVPIRLPALRERRDDIWPLVLHYLDHFQRQMGKEGVQISERMRGALQAHGWPGNVRELINVIERAVALTDAYGVVDMAEIRVRAPRRSWTAPQPESLQGNLRQVMSEVERRVIAEALQNADGNRTVAAKQLGLTRQALAYKLDKHGL